MNYALLHRLSDSCCIYSHFRVLGVMYCFQMTLSLTHVPGMHVHFFLLVGTTSDGKASSTMSNCKYDRDSEFNYTLCPEPTLSSESQKG